MKKGSTPQVSFYVLMILAFFGIVFVLDSVFELHYTPEEHRLNKKKNASQVQSASLNATMVENDSFRKEPYNLSDTLSYEQAATEETLTTPAEEDEEIYFQELKEKYQKEVLSGLPPRKSRTDVTIRYYKHPPDGNSAYVLQKLGFYIHERPVEPGYEDFQSNAIFYGDSVQVEDIQLIAYTLLKEGLPLKTIAPSKYGSNWKSHSIEIGADSTLDVQKTLKLSEIRRLAL